MRRAGAATKRRTGRPTPRRATAARDPAVQGSAVAQRLAAARRQVARGPRHAPARTGRCAAPSLVPAGLRGPAVRKPGPVVRTAWAATGSTGNPRPLSPHREAPRGQAHPYRLRTAELSRPAGPPPAPMTSPGGPARPHRPRTTRPRRPAGPQQAHTPSPGGPVRPRPARAVERSRLASRPPAHTPSPGGPVRPRPAATTGPCRWSGPPQEPRTRRGCRARRPPCRTADRGCPAGADRNTPPGPRTTAPPPPGRGSLAAPRATDVPCRKDPLRRARRRRPGHDRMILATRRRAWPSPGSHRGHAAPPHSRPVHARMAGAAPSAASRHDRASPTLSTHRASSPHGTTPQPAPRGLVPPAGRAVPPRPRWSPGIRPSR
jgi:hypothetical protein